jgi:hypothetical protein
MDVNWLRRGAVTSFRSGYFRNGTNIDPRIGGGKRDEARSAVGNGAAGCRRAAGKNDKKRRAVAGSPFDHAVRDV